MPQFAGGLAAITTAQTMMLLLASPGHELACGGMIAEACARGWPPFVVILTDGASDGTAVTARARELATRQTGIALGLPADRLLFAGLRHDGIPNQADPLFDILLAAMAHLSWRHDCTVLVVPDAIRHVGVALSTATRLPLVPIASAEPPAVDLAGRST